MEHTTPFLNVEALGGHEYCLKMVMKLPAGYTAIDSKHDVLRPINGNNNYRKLKIAVTPDPSQIVPHMVEYVYPFEGGNGNTEVKVVVEVYEISCPKFLLHHPDSEIFIFDIPEYEFKNGSLSSHLTEYIESLPIGDRAPLELARETIANIIEARRLLSREKLEMHWPRPDSLDPPEDVFQVPDFKIIRRLVSSTSMHYFISDPDRCEPPDDMLRAFSSNPSILTPQVHAESNGHAVEHPA